MGSVTNWPRHQLTLVVTRTVLALVLLLAPLTSCGGFQQGFREGYNGATTAAPVADPDLWPGWHHVVYTWGVSRTLKAGEIRTSGSAGTTQ